MISQLLVALIVAWYLVVKWRKRHLTRLTERLKSSLMNLPLIGHMYVLLGNAESLKMIAQLLVAFLVASYLVVKWRKRHMTRLAEQLKSSVMSLPLIGHAYVYIGSGETTMNGLKRLARDAMEGGGTIAHWYPHTLYITIVDPEVADLILKNCLEKEDLVKFFQEGSGDGSIFTSVKKWRPRRKFLAPTFGMKNLNRFVEVFATQSSVLAKKIEGFAGQKPSTMWNLLSAYALDAVCETTIGVQAKSQECGHPNLTSLFHWFQVVSKRVATPWLQFDFIYKRTALHQNAKKAIAQLNNFMQDIITEKRKHYANLNGTSQDKADRLKPFVDLVLESTAEESDLAIREECLVLLGAGTDTSAVSVGFALLMLAAHPEVQEKAYQELKEIFSDSSRIVEADDLHRLKYLDAVVRETLRLYPPVPAIVRKIEKDLKLPSGVVVPAGCGAMISIWGMHHNPAIWGKDVEEFRPERFLDSTPRHPAAFIPFSCGPRNCAGYQYAMMSLKTVLCTVLRKFRLVPASEVLQPLRLEFDIMMRDVDQYRVGIEMRQ